MSNFLYFCKVKAKYSRNNGRKQNTLDGTNP